MKKEGGEGVKIMSDGRVTWGNGGVGGGGGGGVGEEVGALGSL